MNNLDKLQKKIFENKIKKGFNTKDIDTELLLLTEELGEAVRAYRREKKEELVEEIVDIIIYCLGLLGILNVKASEAVLKKIKKNEKRTYKKIVRGWGV